MRQTRNISLNEAGRLVGISGSAIAHIEQGRMDVSRARIATLLQCTVILKNLGETKLQAVDAVLINLVPPGAARQSGH